MKRQRNTTQMKEQTRNTEVQINEKEIGKLPEKEFRIMIVKMIKNLENKMEKMQESINKDLEELKNKHTETNNTITEIKNTLQRIKNYCCLGSNSDHLNQNHKGWDTGIC